ncbi:RCC1 domain-containing protein [Streptomyces sp. NPDC001581]|uniref:RCC1 domain-containing protein n=1 Tax=Streptomyces sp. NPDC001581 TaxID=3154386 RepID=UPI003318D912
MAAGAVSAYAVRNGRVLGWGDNANGQLGNGSTASSLTPVTALPAGSGTTRVAASLGWNSSYAY